MATQAHCAYCFEVLSANLERRPPMSLEPVLRLWKLYLDALPAAARDADDDVHVDDGGYEDDDADDMDMDGAQDQAEDADDFDDDGDDDMPDAFAAAPHPRASQSSNAYRPAAITRLLTPSAASGSSSSVQSVSSSALQSTASSSLASSGAPSHSSSRSSLFSPTPSSKVELAASSRRQLQLQQQQQQQQRQQQASAPPPSAPLMPDHPLFVTWNTLGRGGHKSLRGCIGTFEPQELSEGLCSYALTSYVASSLPSISLRGLPSSERERELTSDRAFDDTRFPPIARSELPALECGVTLLTDFEPCAHALDWRLGTHGLRIAFVHRGQSYGATYLPNIARDQGWSKEETVVSLMRKAGWSGRRDAWRAVDDLKVDRYQGDQVKLPWAEWRAWRDWVDGRGDS